MVKQVSQNQSIWGRVYVIEEMVLKTKGKGTFFFPLVFSI